MASIKMGIGLGLWHQGMPDAPTLFEYIDKAEAWGIDSIWMSDHMIGTRAEVSIGIHARAQCGGDARGMPRHVAALSGSRPHQVHAMASVSTTPAAAPAGLLCTGHRAVL